MIKFICSNFNYIPIKLINDFIQNSIKEVKKNLFNEIEQKNIAHIKIMEEDNSKTIKNKNRRIL